MLEKIGRGADMRRLLEYLLGELDHAGRKRDRVAVVGGTVSSGNILTMTLQYNALRRLRPNLMRSVMHCSLRSSPGDRWLTDQEWASIGKKWAQAMGYQAYTIVRHDQPDGDHIHIAASRINADGSVVPDSWDFRRGELVVRDLEKELELCQVARSHLLAPENVMTESMAFSQIDIQQALAGKRVPRVEIAAAINRALAKGTTTFTEFVASMRRSGVVVCPKMSRQSTDLSGLSFELDGVVLRGGALGKGYSVYNLFKKGLSYSWSRDQQAIRDCLDMVTLLAAAGSGGSGRNDESDRYFPSDLPEKSLPLNDDDVPSPF
ncbi:relaxase/mobilization nuclease-like protein [Nitrospirillum amazonense]|uniref:Relaxase/mobilization nuclease-like protein n=1 Tax=Nitrospirillum amazonense TaxID=28077 RepID=A0A560JHE2_9PROT|nr:relaxase/mobilization nuclease domain-containing protein [Nitrospirillum amazonense]TWB67770.1 relaxase/mobilization nuclease-like protein [Nitrospirillum amazonense]